MHILSSTSLISCVFVFALASAGWSQGGGFVFEEEAPEVPAPTPAAPEPEPEAPPALDDLEEFTFGGSGPAAPEEDSGSAEERTFWASLKVSPTVEGYRQYLEAYPDGLFADDARSEIADLQAAEDRRQGLVASCDTLAGDPNDPSLSEGVAGVAIAEIDADAALWTCSRARAAEPDLPRLSFNLARIAEAQGQEQSALRGYRIALRLAVERTGEPHLPAAEGILRLAGEPRNPTESMSTFLLQFAVDGAGRLKALQGRVAELEAELAVLSAGSGTADSEIAELQAEIEFLNAREIDLLSTLDTAQTQGAEVAAVRAELAALEVLLADRDTTLAALTEARDSALAQIAALESTLAAAQAQVAEAGAGDAEKDAEIVALSDQLNAALASLAAAKRAAEEAANAPAVAEVDPEALITLETLNAALQESLAAAEVSQSETAAEAEILRKQLAEATARLAETRALLNESQSD